MIEHTDITILGITTPKNKLGIADPQQLATAEADFAAFRLAELRTAPVRGGFDSVHLQEIHHHIYQDLYDWAGELRRTEVGNQPGRELEASLNAVFDRLRCENHLKGCNPDQWTLRASSYMIDLGTIQPFLSGNEIALREFAEELARKNNLTIQWNAAPAVAMTELMGHLHQSEQSANIRRIVMLAMDSDPGSLRPSRGHAARGIEKFISIGSPLP